MTTPRTPRGRREKGSDGERAVVAMAKDAGIPVVRRLTITSGCDVILRPEAIWEVKNAPWATYGGVDRKGFLRAADDWRSQGYPHIMFFHELDGWYACLIGRHAKGRYAGKIGLVYKEPIADLLARKGGLHPGAGNAMGRHAESGAGQMPTGAIGGEGASLAMGHTRTAAPPAKPECDHKPNALAFSMNCYKCGKIMFTPDKQRLPGEGA